MIIKVLKLDPKAVLPTKSYPGDAGWDLYSAEEVTLWHGRIHVFRTGIATEVPEGYYAQVLGRSSLAALGIVILGGVIDARYRGELRVVALNMGGAVWEVKPGDRIAQFVLVPVPGTTLEEVAELAPSDRGEKGFGSTGR